MCIEYSTICFTSECIGGSHSLSVLFTGSVVTGSEDDIQTLRCGGDQATDMTACLLQFQAIDGLCHHGVTCKTLSTRRSMPNQIRYDQYSPLAFCTVFQQHILKVLLLFQKYLYRTTCACSLATPSHGLKFNGTSSLRCIRVWDDVVFH
jgi:hypothetical protein